MCRLVSPILFKKKGGRIINISSVSGVYGNAGQVNYSASKAGLIGITKSLSKELGGRSITVNAIAPGFIDTEMTRALSDDVRTKAAEKISLKRFGSIDDIANAVCFLAGEKGGYITGQVLVIDGGLAL
jgi:3-oxoacyl-[acyl-carrier protein] reductase